MVTRKEQSITERMKRDINQIRFTVTFNLKVSSLLVLYDRKFHLGTSLGVVDINQRLERLV